LNVKVLTFIAGVVVIVLAATGSASAQGWIGRGARPEPERSASEQPGLLSKIRIDQKLDAPVPADLAFVDEEGRSVTLGQYFGKRPLILALVYYECPMLCTQVLNGLTSSLSLIKLNPGEDFDVLAVSFDPGEGPGLAREKKKSYMARYKRPGTESGFHFLTGDAGAIDRLTDAVGFRYAYDEKTDQYAHAATIIVLTPEGHVSRYFYGIEYMPRDVRLGLVEASKNQIGSLVDQALLLCYHYDPSDGKYGVAIINLIRLVGAVVIAIFGAFVIVSLRRERRQVHA
jgi:protein SCO1/2